MAIIFFPRLLLPPLSLYHLFYGMETYKTIFPKISEGDEAQRSAHRADYPNRLFIPIIFNIHKYHVMSSYIREYSGYLIYINIPAIKKKKGPEAIEKNESVSAICFGFSSALR